MFLYFFLISPFTGINVLHGFSDSMPATIEEMMSTVGVTANWFEMWGEDFLQVCVLSLYEQQQ